MNKQVVVFLHNKEEWESDTYNNVDEPQKYYAEWKKPDLKSYIVYESILPRAGQTTEVESRLFIFVPLHLTLPNKKDHIKIGTLFIKRDWNLIKLKLLSTENIHVLI